MLRRRRAYAVPLLICALAASGMAPLTSHFEHSRSWALAAAVRDTGTTVTLSPPVALGMHGSLRVERYGPLVTRHRAYPTLPTPQGIPRGAESTGMVLRADFAGSAMANVANPHPALRSNSSRTLSSPSSVRALSLPDSVDLSRFDPAVGDQGGVNSCMSWALAYGLLGWYGDRDGYAGSGTTAGFAPMYVYSQVTQGQNISTYAQSTLSLLQSQGVDTRAHYSHGDQDYVDQPNQSEHDNAANYKIASWGSVPYAANATTQQAIEAALSGGNPVGITMYLFDNFYNAGPSSPYIDLPTAAMNYRGFHGVFAVKYDPNGLWIQNQWGTSWGLQGYAELSWTYVNTYVQNAFAIVPAHSPVTSTATSTGTPVPPTATMTSTRTATATATSTPVPPTATSTATAPASTGAPMLAVTLRRSGSFRPGQRVTYMVTVRNVGTGPTSAPIALTTHFPAGVAPQLSPPLAWSCTMQSTDMGCQSPAGQGAVQAQGQLRLQVPVSISPTLAHPTRLVVVVSAATTGATDTRYATAPTGVSIP